jgi:hypothetical protein
LPVDHARNHRSTGFAASLEALGIPEPFGGFAAADVPPIPPLRRALLLPTRCRFVAMRCSTVTTDGPPEPRGNRLRAAAAGDRCRRDGKAHVAPKPFALTPPQCPPASEQRPSLAAGCGRETLVRVIAVARHRGHKTSMRHRGSLVIFLASAFALSTGSANGAVPAHRGHPPMPRPSASKPKASTSSPAAPKPAVRPHR